MIHKGGDLDTIAKGVTQGVSGVTQAATSAVNSVLKTGGKKRRSRKVSKSRKVKKSKKSRKVKKSKKSRKSRKH